VSIYRALRAGGRGRKKGGGGEKKREGEGGGYHNGGVSFGFRFCKQNISSWWCFIFCKTDRSVFGREGEEGKGEEGGGGRGGGEGGKSRPGGKEKKRSDLNIHHNHLLPQPSSPLLTPSTTVIVGKGKKGEKGAEWVPPHPPPASTAAGLTPSPPLLPVYEELARKERGRKEGGGGGGGGGSLRGRLVECVLGWSVSFPVMFVVWRTEKGGGGGGGGGGGKKGGGRVLFVKDPGVLVVWPGDVQSCGLFVVRETFAVVDPVIVWEEKERGGRKRRKDKESGNTLNC